LSALVLIALAGTLVSCAHETTSSENALRLDTLAAREQRRAPASTRDVPVPPGMPESLSEPIALGPTARTPLEDALVAAATREIELPTLAATPPLSEALRLSSTRMYAQARTALLAGNQAEAADLYARVVAIDPSAAEAWASLAMVEAAQGDLPAAAEAWQSALAADPSNTRALEQLGLAALRSNDLAKAITLLARARLNEPERVDAALPYLLDAALADAMEQSGAMLAAAQAAERAASAPAPFDLPTNEQRRLLSLLRQRSFLLRGAGDMQLRLGDVQAATAAYLAALELDDTLDAPTVARAIYSQRRLGADASAAATLVHELERSDGRVNALHIRLVEHLSDTLPSEIAGAFAESLPGISVRGGWEDTPAARSAAARLDAAGQPTPERSTEVLLAYLLSAPADDAATEQLARTASATPNSLASALARLTAAYPLRAPYFASLFARATTNPDAFESAIATIAARSEPTPEPDRLMTTAQGATLGQAWLSLRTGRAERSLDLFDALARTESLSAYAQLGRIESLFALGRIQEASAAADALARGDDPVTRLLAAEANAHLQRNDEAFLLLRPLTLPGALPDRERAEALLLAARAAATIGQMDSAERWLVEAIGLAPLREDAYAGLLQIAFAGGAQRNQAQLADIVRRLRENIPTSRTLRLLQARELAGQGQPVAALEILTDLLALDPRDESAQEQYIATLIATGRAATAEAWLRDRIEQGRAEPSTVVLLARVLTASDRAEEAEQLLREKAEEYPRNDALLRERENLLRGPLNKPIAADELALDRLTTAPPTLDNTIELAEVQARLGRWSDAGASLERALSQAGVSLRRDQRERVARAIGFFAASANEIDDPTARFAADAAGLLVDDPAGAPDALQRSRIVLLVRAGAPISELVSASETPAQANRDLALQLRLGAADMLKDAGQVDRAFELLNAGARMNGEIAPEILSARMLLATEFDRPQESIAAIQLSIDSGTVTQTYATLNRMFGDASADLPSPDALAYLAAQLFGSRGMEDSATALYEYILQLNPDHPWAANNLGYGLAERGEDLLRAYDLLQRAYAQLPSETAIIDSIGWVRYRVGIFDDTVNANGQKVEGAITLLRRAAATGGEPLDYVMHEHAGDALWRGGKPDDAVRSWRIADRLALTAIERLTQQPDPTPELLEFVEDLRTARASISARIAAASQPGGEPDTPEVFENLRDAALKIPVPDLRPAQPGAPGA
jgi:Tfp pilus assembly protein PilF